MTCSLLRIAGLILFVNICIMATDSDSGSRGRGRGCGRGRDHGGARGGARGGRGRGGRRDAATQTANRLGKKVEKTSKGKLLKWLSVMHWTKATNRM